MYVGRIVAIGKTRTGANGALYRVSSRSYPNRRVMATAHGLVVIPRPGHEADAIHNPYVAYTAVRLAGGFAVAANGSHTDPITEKIAAGTSPRDALAATLLALDYEHDDLSTPRVAGVVPLGGDVGWLGIVRKDALVVKEVPLQQGRAWYVATYQADDIRLEQTTTFDARDAVEAARFALEGGIFASLEHPVASGAALSSGASFTLGTFHPL